MTFAIITLIWVVVVLLVVLGFAGFYALLAHFTLDRAKAREVNASANRLESELAWMQADRVKRDQDLAAIATSGKTPGPSLKPTK